jgi:hypothetical protein
MMLVVFHVVCAAIAWWIWRRLDTMPLDARIVTRRLAEDTAREAFEGVCWNVGMAVVFYFIVDGKLQMSAATIILWPAICLKFGSDTYRKYRTTITDTRRQNRA